jgi:hypothetical protein
MTHLPFLAIIKIQLPSNNEDVLDGDWKIWSPSNTPHHQMVTEFFWSPKRPLGGGGWLFFQKWYYTHPPFLGDKKISVTIQHTPPLDGN